MDESQRIPMDEQGTGGGPRPRNGDKIIIAVLGVTGAGKSTFINTASGRDVMKISHGSKPCTQGPKAVEFKMDGRTIVLIDTPGFDDDKRTDVRILEDIAIWMARKGYLNEEKLDGLIFLHPVTFTRAGGSELSRTKLLEKILGPGAYNRVIITTTMWDYVTDERVIQERLNTRFAKKGTWYKLSRKGASYAKHYDTQTSAHDIIRRIMKITDTQGKPTTLLERQLESEKGRVVNTWAGKAVERDIVKRIKIYQEERSKHLDCRPPASYRNDKVSEHKEEWKRWNKRNEELQKGLAREEAELKKLQNIVARAINFVISWFK